MHSPKQEGSKRGDDVERPSILNASRRTLPGPVRLHELVSSSLPDQVAIDFLDADGGRLELTYQSMVEHAGRVGVQIQQSSSIRAKGSVIPVLMPQCPELYISYLAILQAGAGFCPLQPNIPTERLKFVADDVNAKLVLTTSEYASYVVQNLPEVNCQVISLAGLERASSQRHLLNSVPIEADENDIAYVMYTSGSTGLPKGVRISHKSVVQSLLAHDEHIPPFKRFLQFASPTFDVSVFEIFFPFFRGATIVCCERERMLADLAATINALDVDIVELTPTVATTLLRRRKAVPGLRILLTIGEMLNKSVIEEFGGSETQESMLYAMYGPTEASIHCTIAPKLSSTSSVGNIGVPLSTVTALILSDISDSFDARVLPFGHTGELAIAGQLACGYLNRNQETSAAFIEMPPFGKVYRTGDRALIKEDSTLQILGRISDSQVKLRGQRIELGEIEQVACRAAGVDQSVGTIVNENIILFCAGSQELVVAEVQKICKSWLPHFMRPNEIIVLAEGMPRLPSGKIDRQKLMHSVLAKQADEMFVDGDFQDDVTHRVVQIIGRELRIKVGFKSCLWEHGLDSLKCIKIASELRSMFPQATMTMLMESDTIEDVVAKLAVVDPSPKMSEATLPIKEEKDWNNFQEFMFKRWGNGPLCQQVEKLLPCAQIQTAMLAETTADVTTNFNTIYLHHGENITTDIIQTALRMIAAKNEILRSGFMASEDTEPPFVQIVWKTLSFDHKATLLHPIYVYKTKSAKSTAIKIHHAIYDGWSWDLIMSDLNRVIAGAQIPDRPQFNGFQQFANSWRDSNYDKDAAYWSNALQKIQPRPFPNLCSKMANGSPRRSCRKVMNLNMADEAMKTFLKSTRITQQTLVQTAYSILLCAYYDMSDAVYGVVSSGREMAFEGMDQLLGPCLTTYPMRLDLQSVSNARDLLHYVQRTNVDFLKHNSLSLGEIKHLSNISAAQLLFDTIFVWQEGPEATYQKPASVTVSDTEDALQYCLHLESGRENDLIWTKLTYNEGKLPAEHAALFLQQMEGVITCIVKHPQVGLTDIWTSIDDKAMSRYNPDIKPFCSHWNLSTTIEALAEKDPDRIALEFVTRFDNNKKRYPTIDRLSYRELYKRASSMAKKLANRFGAKSDHLICIHLEKSPEMYITILAAVLSGAGYMCIDPTAPDVRVSRIIKEAQCKLIITSEDVRLKRLVNSNTTVITIAQLSATHISKHVNLPPQSADQSLAYAVFTSGSTGVPKGVLITRRNLISNIDYLANIYPCDCEKDKLLQACSQAFDVSVFEIFWTWHMGMILCSAKNETIFADIEGLINSMSITHLSMTPSVASLIEPSTVPTVKMLVTAGEPMSPKVFNSWKDKGRLYQGYGPSETTNICNIMPNVASDDLMNNVGSAFTNTSIFICARQQISLQYDSQTSLDTRQPVFRPLPVGAVGEIWIGGDQVGRGYMNRELTTESWLDHPDFGILYRSGDMGRLLSNGDLIVLGREDDQIKLRGLRIELGEVNSALTRHPNVKNAFTFVAENPNTARLISFVVDEPQETDGWSKVSQDVYHTLEGMLADYMIPDLVIPLERMPLTRQGKIDKQILKQKFEALNDEDRSRFSRGRENRHDEIELSVEEAEIASLIAEVTGAQADKISRHVSFYAIGLDSINGIRLAQALGKSGFEQVDVSMILKNASISRLLPIIQKQKDGTRELLPKHPGGVDPQLAEKMGSQYRAAGYTVAKVLPCTALQEAILSSQTDNTRSAYWNRLSWKIVTNVEDIYQAWKEMVKRHDLLRTAFIESHHMESPYLQVVLEDFKLPWSTRNNVLDHTEPQNGGLRLPPYHFWYEKIDTDGSLRLYLTMSHAIYDAEAMETLLKEVENLIYGRKLGKAQQFAAYIGYVNEMDCADTDVFWNTLLKGSRPTRLADLILQHERVSITCKPQTTRWSSCVNPADLEVFARSHSISVSTVLQAALARVLLYSTASRDILFGNVFNGRNLPIEDIDSVVGPCFNTLPMRANLSDRTSIFDLLKDLHHQALDLLQYQPSSLRRIQKQMSPDGRLLFDILLLSQQEEAVLDPTIWVLEKDEGDMDFPFILEIVPQMQHTKLLIQLHHQKCSRNLAKMLLHDFDMLLEQIINFPQALAADFNTLHMSLPVMRAQHTSAVNGDAVPTTKGREWTAIEQEVGTILQDLSGCTDEKLFPTTSIFELGLDSISAVKLASRLRGKGFDLNSADVLEHATIQDIAKHCGSRVSKQSKSDDEVQTFLKDFDHQHRGVVAEQSGVDHAVIESVLPCTPAQTGILSQYLSSDSMLYYNRIRLALNGEVDLPRLKHCWTEIVAKSEILRTGFWQLNSAKHPFAMIVFRPGVFDIPWQQTELSSKDASLREFGGQKDLQRPAWEILVSQHGDSTYMDIGLLHALYDARALEILLSDVATLYSFRKLQRRPSLTATIAKMLRLNQESSEAERYWKEKSESVECTKFPDLNTHRQPTQRMMSTAISSHITISDAQTRCSRLGVSLQSVCMAAWAKLVAMYCGQTNVSFGVIISGRNIHDENFDDDVFPFINTVPLAVKVAENNQELLSTVSKHNAKLLQFQHVPLTSIKRWAGIHDEFFDTVFVLQKTPNQTSNQTQAHDLWEIIEDEASSEYVISLEVLPVDVNYHFQLTFRPDKVPQEQAIIILKQYEAILDVFLAAENEAGIADTKLLSVLPPKVTEIPTDAMFLHELVEITTALKPHSTALEFVTALQEDSVTKQTWTYQQLNECGDQIANLLIGHHAQVGELVAVCFDKCPEASFAILGVLKAGCAYVAIDPDAPVARKKFILQDAKCKILLTTRTKADSFDVGGVVILAVDDSSLLAGTSRNPPVLEQKLTGQHICYCLYTSGTTGTPKGCLISHTSAVQAMLSFSRIFQGRWTEDSRWLQFASFHFDVSVLEQYWSWSVGIRVTSAHRDLLFEDLPGNIRRLRITHLDLTPSLATMLRPDLVPLLANGIFIVGGEQVRQEILDIWGDTGCLYNFYGPSEVTIGCTVHPQVRKDAKPSNIGQQWDNVGSFVLDPKSDEPVLRGAIGELCLSGTLVGKSYLNRPDLTRNKFCTLENFQSTRIYRTGDLVRMLHDDSFDFLGRIDDQLKLRGQRLEVGEIDHIISGSCGDIQDVATTIMAHPTLEKEQLVAFFTISRGRKEKDRTPTLLQDEHSTHIAEQARNACMDKLPAYMIPNDFIGIDFMPLTSNNKSDIKKLRTLYGTAAVLQTSSFSSSHGEAPTDLPDNLEHIRAILASYLDVEPAGVKHQSGLFELGLDSISIIGLARVMKQAGFLAASIPTIMKNTKVLDLARALQVDREHDVQDFDIAAAKSEIESFSRKHSPTITTNLDVEPDEIEAVTPCTPLQLGMISKVVRSEDVDKIPYFGRFTYLLHERISLDRLQQAWKKTVNQLAILRTRFVSTEDGHAQVMLKKTKLSALHLFGNVNSDDMVQAFHHWVTNSRQFGQNLPWQLAFTRGEDRHIYMTLFIFHGLYDGIALPLLLSLVEQNYTENNTVYSSLHQFHDVLPHGPLLRSAKAKDFWQHSLKQVVLLGLDESPEEPTAVTKVVEKVSYPGLTQLCNRVNVTAPAAFHAAWLYALFKIYHVNPTIGIVLSGRSISFDGAENVIGPMFNTVPCSIHHLPDTPTMFDLLKGCHEFNVSCLPYQHTSIRDIARWTNQGRQRDLFDSLFVFQRSTVKGNGTSTTAEANSGHALWIEMASDGQPDYPLNIEINQINDIGEFNITILAKKAKLMSTRTVQTLLQHLQTTLTEICENKNFELPLAFNSDTQGPVKEANNFALSSEDRLDASSSSWDTKMDVIRDELAHLAGAELSSLKASSPTIFELGLDSIDAMKLATRLKMKGLALSVSKIMQNPTIGGIAQHSEKANSATKKQKENSTVTDLQQLWQRSLANQGVTVDANATILPVTPMQEGLLLRFEDYYNILTYHVRSDIDVERLSDAIKAVADSMTVLRSTYIAMEDTSIRESFVQVVQNKSELEIQHVQLESLSQLFDVSQNLRDKCGKSGLSGQKVHVIIARVGQSSTVLLLGLPHAMYDGWSIELIHRAIRSTYDGLTNRDDLSLVIEHIDETRRQSNDAKVARFWKQMLQDASPTHLTFPDAMNLSSATLIDQQSRISLSLVLKSCKQIGITLQSFGLACWALLLATKSKRLDVCHGVVLSGRTMEGVDQLAFPAFNTVVFRTLIEQTTTSEEFLKQVNHNSINVMENQHFPLKKSLQFQKNSMSEMFNTLFTFQRPPPKAEKYSTLYQEYSPENQTLHPPYAVNIELVEKDNALWWTCAVQDNVANDSLVRDLLQQLDNIGNCLVLFPERKLIEDTGDGVSICGLKIGSLQQNLEMNYGSAKPKNIDQGVDTRWNTTELQIRSVLAEIAKVNKDQIQKSTSIFHLGLDSISAIKIAGQLRKRGLRLPVSKIIRAQTVVSMASAMSKLDPEDSSSSNVDMTSHDLEAVKLRLTEAGVSSEQIESVLPAAAGSVYMLDAWQESKGLLFYADFWFSATSTTKEIFQESFKLLEKAVPALRTSFVTVQKATFAVTLKSNIPSRMESPWSLETKQVDDKVLARLRIHHALYDAVGLHIMVDALTDLCRDRGTKLNFHTNPISFLRVTRGSHPDAVHRRRDFWTSYLSDVEARERRTLAGTFSTNRSQKFVANVMPAETLKPVLRAHGISIQMLFFAAYAKVHASLYQKDGAETDMVVLGVYMANRFLDVEHIDSLVTPTFNILPLKVRTSTSSLAEMARNILNDIQMIGQADYCGTSLREIYSWTGLKLDGYLNYLRLPDDHDHQQDGDGNDESTGEHHQQAKVQHAEGESLYDAQSSFRDEARDAFIDQSTKVISPYLLDQVRSVATDDTNGNESVNDVVDTSYVIPAIDVEARVMPDGNLAIGLFAPKDILSAQAVDGVIEDVKKKLQEFTDDHQLSKEET